MKTINDIVLEGVEKHLDIKNPKLNTNIPGETFMQDIELIIKDVVEIYGYIPTGRPQLARNSNTPKEIILFLENNLKDYKKNKEEE